jgi:hypothetical protein
MEEDIPPPQMLREIQPNAKFIITLADPVKRMYSDYYFLEDNLRPVRPNSETTKSAEEFHVRSVVQVQEFNKCVADQMELLKEEYADLPRVSEEKWRWIRGSQM